VARRSKRLGLRWRARRLAAVAGVVVGASVLGVAPTAMAADQEVNHFRDIGTDTDPDFCGTGKQVDVAFNVRVTEWFAPHKRDYKSVATGEVDAHQSADRRHGHQPLRRAVLGGTRLRRSRRSTRD
jgi:hypothetical protein